LLHTPAVSLLGNPSHRLEYVSLVAIREVEEPPLADPLATSLTAQPSSAYGRRHTPLPRATIGREHNRDYEKRQEVLGECSSRNGRAQRDPLAGGLTYRRQ
jgi:hypothetical protein